MWITFFINLKNQSIWKVPLISKVLHGTIYTNKQPSFLRVYHFKCQQAGERDSKWTPHSCLLTHFLIRSSPQKPTSLYYRRYCSLRTSQTRDDISLFLKISLCLARYKFLFILHAHTNYKSTYLNARASPSITALAQVFAANYKILVWWRSKLRSYAAGMRLFVRAKLFTRKLQLGKGKKGGWSGRGQRGELAVSGRHNSKIGY